MSLSVITPIMSTFMTRYSEAAEKLMQDRHLKKARHTWVFENF